MLRILVAEDRPENQYLIEVYLRGTSHVLTFVDDGAAAVERFREAVFDLILMDVRMPRMDGLAATRAIRGIERERGGGAIPIIALTAGAWPEDIAQTRQAGSTAHIAKPYSMEELRLALQTHSPRGLRPDMRPGTVVVDVPEGLEEICPEYLAARRDDCKAMERLIASREFEPVRALAHDMKGTGRSYGFDLLTEFGSAMETLAIAGDSVALAAQLADLQQYLGRVRLEPVGPAGSSSGTAHRQG